MMGKEHLGQHKLVCRPVCVCACVRHMCVCVCVCVCVIISLLKACNSYNNNATIYIWGPSQLLVCNKTKAGTNSNQPHSP